MLTVFYVKIYLKNPNLANYKKKYFFCISLRFPTTYLLDFNLWDLKWKVCSPQTLINFAAVIFMCSAIREMSLRVTWSKAIRIKPLPVNQLVLDGISRTASHARKTGPESLFPSLSWVPTSLYFYRVRWQNSSSCISEVFVQNNISVHDTLKCQ